MLVLPIFYGVIKDRQVKYFEQWMPSQPVSIKYLLRIYAREPLNTRADTIKDIMCDVLEILVFLRMVIYTIMISSQIHTEKMSVIGAVVLTKS